MIGQHIYSRCLEGYFTKASLNADTTTVTMTKNMFPKEEQAKKVAAECERISTLEDVRPVPNEVQGAYRGVLKIHRLGRQITVVCRSYRLHSGNNGFESGEHRDFTYSSNYILTGTEKSRFLNSPEYCMNLRDFEPYPSITKRIAESRMAGNNGRIEANPRYSLFNSECIPVGVEIFEQVGFTEKLFIEYISSLIDRIAYSTHSGYEDGKVLVVLPELMNVEWERSGGNKYAEQVMLATLKVLPSFLRDQLNVTTGGKKDPGANVLKKFQLVFMENGNSREWRRSEYSIIDLARQESFVKDNLDTTVGQFIWDNLYDEKKREDFSDSYKELFGMDAIEKGNNYLEKLSYVLKIWEEEQNDFSDPRRRVQFIRELIRFSGDDWTEKATRMVISALKKEYEEPTFSAQIEKSAFGLARSRSCPSELRSVCVEILLLYVIEGKAANEIVEYFYQGIRKKAVLITEKMAKGNREISNRREENWEKNESLMSLYKKVAQDGEIEFVNETKGDIYNILSDWFGKYVDNKNWDNALEVLNMKLDMLKANGVPNSVLKEAFESVMMLLFSDRASVRSEADTILKKYEKKELSDRNKRQIFWSSLCDVFNTTNNITKESVTHLVLAARINHTTSHVEEWMDLCRELLDRFANTCPNLLYDEMQGLLLDSISKQEDVKEKAYIRDILADYITLCLNRQESTYKPDMEILRVVLRTFEEDKALRRACELIYLRYLQEEGDDKRRSFLRNRLNTQEQWMILTSWYAKNIQDSILQNFCIEKCKNAPHERKDFLNILLQYEWHEQEEQINCAVLFFELMKNDSAGSQRTDVQRLEALCSLYDAEYPIISKEPSLKNVLEEIKKLFVEELDNYDDKAFYALSEKNMRNLVNLDLAKPGSRLAYMPIILEIGNLQKNNVAGDLDDVRRKVANEKDIALKKRYFDALESKKEDIKKKAEKGNDEILYAISLLQIQIDEEVRGTNKDWLDILVMNLFGIGNINQSRLYSALRVLDVMSQSDMNMGDQNYSLMTKYREALRAVSQVAADNVDLFTDAEIFRAYKKLDKKIKADLMGSGLRSYLKGLPKEWQEKYGLVRSTDISLRESQKSSKAPLIFGILFMLLGIAMLAAFAFLFDKIGGAAVITSIVLTGIGAIGNIVTITIDLLTGKEE